MRLNNKGFLLYEALISLVVLSSFIMFYTSLIQIVQKQQYYNEVHFDALMSFKKSMYNEYENGSYIKFNEKDYYSKESKGEYCIVYEQYKNEKEICD